MMTLTVIVGNDGILFTNDWCYHNDSRLPFIGDMITNSLQSGELTRRWFIEPLQGCDIRYKSLLSTHPNLPPQRAFPIHRTLFITVLSRNAEKELVAIRILFETPCRGICCLLEIKPFSLNMYSLNEESRFLISRSDSRGYTEDSVSPELPLIRVKVYDLDYPSLLSAESITHRIHHGMSVEELKCVTQMRLRDNVVYVSSSIFADDTRDMRFTPEGDFKNPYLFDVDSRCPIPDPFFIPRDPSFSSVNPSYLEDACSSPFFSDMHCASFPGMQYNRIGL